MNKYVVGFMFDRNFEHVALIEKKRPEWQAGKLNGIGGKVEPTDNTPIDGMSREFLEETGVSTKWMDWTPFMVHQFDGGLLYCYYTIGDPFQAKSITDERVVVINTQFMHLYDMIPNVRWMIEMAKSFSKGERAIGFRVTEVG